MENSLFKKIAKKISVVTLFILLLSVKIVIAAENVAEQPFDKVSTDFGDVTTLGKYVGAVFTWSSTIIGSLAVLVIIFAGYRYMTSAGNPEQAEKAKKLIITAIASLILVILAIIIIRAINPKIQLGF